MFAFDDVRILNVLADSKSDKFFSRPIIEFESRVYRRRMFTQIGHQNKLMRVA